MDVRRLYLQQGYSSLFTYCTSRLHLSEHAAYGRIEAARISRKFPAILDRLADGSITLTTVCLLSNHLTLTNHEQVLIAASYKTRREVEQLVATLRPLPEAPSWVRKLPRPAPLMAGTTDGVAMEPAAPVVACSPALSTREEPSAVRPPAPAIVRPVAPERYKVQFTIGPETHRKLRTVQQLMRHVVPNGDVGEIFDRALTLLLRDVERRKVAAADRPRAPRAAPADGRRVPASIRREVWARDRGQCAYVGSRGRCEERGFLEFHHVIPFADGGQTTVENLQLRCRAHNDYEARVWFG
jgi:hypothetical protein